LGIGVVDVDQVLDAVCPVDAGAPSADHDVAPASQRLADQEQGAHAPTLVLVVLARRPPGRDRRWGSDLRQQLAAGLVQADLRAARVIGPGVDPKHVLHPPDELRVLLGWDAPALGQPRLELVCARPWGTASSAPAPTTGSSPSRSPSSRNVQRLWPSGGALQVSATRWASCSPSNRRRYWRAGGLREIAAARR